MTAPWASAAAWRDAPYPRAAIVDSDHLVVAWGARHTYAAPPGASAAETLAAIPADAFVVGCSRFAPAGEGAVDDTWAPFAGALWFEPARRESVPLPDTERSSSTAPDDAGVDVVDAGDVVDVVDVDGARFRDAVSGALARVGRGDVAKLVLARRFFVPWPGAFSRAPALFGALLATAGPTTGSGGVPYLIAPRAGCALLGLSPERLVVVDDASVATDAVAGTRATARASELLSSDKDAREHALVVHHLREALAAAGGAAPQVGPRQLRTVGAVTHLHTSVRAERTAQTTVASLVRALHPTPAVAGWPTDAAVRALATLEGFDRGVYGGLVGLVGPRRASLSVALRGALVTDDGLWITVGAGVVAGSTVEGEDAETRLKLDAVLASLGLRRGRA